MTVTREDIDALIEKQLDRVDLSAGEVLHLTIARRLNGCSDHTFAAALGGKGDLPPLNFWGKR